MKKFQAIAMAFSLFLSLSYCRAQDSGEGNILQDSRHSYFKASLSYLSDNVYLGRKDSLKVPYMDPTLGYYAKSGIFFTASASYFPSESRVDAFTFAGGYRFSTERWTGEVTANKYFYNSQSYSVRSEEKGEIGGQFSYNTGPVELNMSATTSFITKACDIAAGFGLDHDFSAFNDQIDITPTFTVNGGTQNYYDAYYRRRRYVTRRQGNTVSSYKITAYTVDPSAFRILDYEASILIDYNVNKLTFSFTPTLAIPVNPNTIVRTIQPVGGIPVTKTYDEKINTVFYWSLELAYKF
jgi:hypothetical protein